MLLSERAGLLGDGVAGEMDVHAGDISNVPLFVGVEMILIPPVSAAMCLNAWALQVTAGLSNESICHFFAVALIWLVYRPTGASWVCRNDCLLYERVETSLLSAIDRCYKSLRHPKHDVDSPSHQNSYCTSRSWIPSS